MTNLSVLFWKGTRRNGQFISERELDWYSKRIGISVVDGMQYFIGNNHDYPSSENQYSAAIGAHITHMLRDTISDISNGFINIPIGVTSQYNIDDLHSATVRSWIKDRVFLARRYFKEGKVYNELIETFKDL